MHPPKLRLIWSQKSVAPPPVAALPNDADAVEAKRQTIIKNLCANGVAAEHAALIGALAAECFADGIAYGRALRATPTPRPPLLALATPAKPEDPTDTPTPA